MDQQIWVVCDNIQKCNTDVIFGLISKAVELANQTGYCTVAVCMGKQSSENMEELFYYGIDRVLYIRSEEDSQEAYSGLLEKAIAIKRPKMIMFPSSDFGRCLAAYTSINFEAGLTAECIEISVGRENKFEFKRAAINLTAIATIQCVNCDLELCSVKENVFLPLRLNRQKDILIETLDYDSCHFHGYKNKKMILHSEKKLADKNDLDFSKIVFGMGRGIRKESTAALLYQVAAKIGAQVVGTRAAVEEKLIDSYCQVGQSGISIAPEIYIGFGISGASQHMVGIKNAKTIIAVNIDENAPIFEYADYIIQDDVENVLKGLESRLS